jgi:ribosome-binding factor A
MQGKRVDRVGHLIQMELGNLILHRVKDPRLGFVTITHVDVTADLKSARVFYSVLGDEKAKKSSQTALGKAAGFLQKEVGRVVQMRYTPKLVFLLDDTIDRSIEIDRVIQEIRHKDGEGNG